jgi:hypothetical protein
VLTDLLGGNIDLTFIQYSAFYELHREGKVRILAVASEKRIPALQGQELIEVEIDGDDLGGEAEFAERASHGFGGEQRVDLVRTFTRRGMHDGDEAAWLERHQARLRSCSLPGRARPSRASP